MKNIALLSLALLAACGSVNGPGPSGDDIPPGDDVPPGDDTTNPEQTLVADWMYRLATGYDEIDMSSSSSGTASMYWYDSGQATWLVSAVDSGTGAASLHFTCTSANCSDADDITWDCTYTYTALDCLGTGGGYQDNYDGYPLHLTKEGL